MIAWRCTSFLVGEYTRADLENEPIFAIADGIIHFDSYIEGRRNRRTLSVVKMRGVDCFEGLHSISISKVGISVFPRVKTPPSLSFSLSDKKTTTGISRLNEMMEGGLPIGSSTLIIGETGTGKTTLSLHFLMEGVEKNEQGLLVSFQEPADQIKMIARGFGFNIEKMIKGKKLSILYASPVELDLDEHAFLVKKEIEQAKIKRVAIDSLMDIKFAAFSPVHFRDHIYSLVNFFKSCGITSILTDEIPEIFVGAKSFPDDLSFIADNFIILGYKKEDYIVKRTLTLLKMRGSEHDKAIKEFEITSKGMVIK